MSFHPDLLPWAPWLPRSPVSSLTRPLLRWLTAHTPAPKVRADVLIEDKHTPEGAVRVRMVRPAQARGPLPALVWMHGGGYIIGAPEQDEALTADISAELGVVVASVNYRIAPEHPFPAPLDDCAAALRWLHGEAAALGVRPDRVAVGGASAGAGLAAALAQRAHDEGLPVAFQLLIYPMLDDRTVTRADLDTTHQRIWSQTSNRLGWSAYLGQAPGADATPPYAVPARRESLGGLPPAWIGVGTLDLFHDEDVAYAQRLTAAGVPTELVVVPGAYHGFDGVQESAAVSRAFRDAAKAALRRALFAEAALR
jgi:acetyl esterase/lipase